MNFFCRYILYVQWICIIGIYLTCLTVRKVGSTKVITNRHHSQWWGDDHKRENTKEYVIFFYSSSWTIIHLLVYLSSLFQGLAHRYLCKKTKIHSRILNLWLICCKCSIFCVSFIPIGLFHHMLGLTVLLFASLSTVNLTPI